MEYQLPTKAVITDAGFASRYLPITKTVPKGMLPLGNRPIMQFVIEECVAAGITEIIIVATSEGHPIYEDYFNNAVNRIRKQLAAQGKEDRYQPVQHVLDFPKITVIEQDPSYPYGNGSPIASAQPFIKDDEAFIAAYSDDVVFGHSAVQDLITAFKEHPDAAAIITGQEVPHAEISKYGSIDYNAETGQLNGIVEKPKPEEAASDLASYGRYLLTPEIFQHLDPKNTGRDGELWTVDAIARLIPTGRVYVKRSTGRWMTTGDPKNYFFTHLHYALDNEVFAAEIRDYIQNNKGVAL